ncbi:MAG TPA: lipoprotein-releasing ABC transporter permease subunit [Dongiaceae bacterium]|jgi:lipoprotein-releasing system permease protein|nr:lipoprotein-releasing ABC transporter permease subunit [Dongiaceae bacterium]
MIFAGYESWLALRYLRARRQEGFISVIAGFSLVGIALGVATLIVVMSVMNGFHLELVRRIVGLNGHLTVTSTGPMTNYAALTEKIAGIPGVVAANPLVEGQVFVNAHGAGTGAVMRGMRPMDFRARKAIADHLVGGSLADFSGEDPVAIGVAMAQRLAVGVGDEITVITPRLQATMMGALPRIASYRVAAIFDVGMYEYNSAFLYVPIEAAQLLFKLPDAATGIEIVARSPDQVPAIGRELLHLLDDTYAITDWQRANASLVNAVKVERNVMFLILTLIIVVAAFNIISSQIMLVKEKARNIAILRTMGASRASILRIFLLTGSVTGILGTCVGTALGIAFAKNIDTIRRGLESFTGTTLFDQTIYFLSQLPALVEPADVALIAAMAFSLSVLASLYPAWRAARLDPVTALRYE